MQLAVGDGAERGNRTPEALTEVIDAHVGGRLRLRRLQVGLSQAALGQHMGVTFSQVQKYEKGSNRIGAGRLYRMAALLGVSVLYFFEGLEGTVTRTEAGAAEAARLQDAFKRISDPQTRQALVSLALAMVEDS